MAPASVWQVVRAHPSAVQPAADNLPRLDQARDLRMRALSTGPDARLELRLDAQPKSVAVVRRELGAFVDEHFSDASPDIALAVSEAVSNVVLHAYRDEGPGTVRVVACVRPTELVVVVRDYGVGMRPHPESPGAGLGLSIIGAATSAMNVERPDDGGTRIRLRFRRLARVAA
jgi:serine/threonine-protein kinase RsbW